MRVTLGNKLALGFSLVLLPMLVALLVGLNGFHTDVDTYAEVLAEGEALLSRVAGTKNEYEALVQQVASVSSMSEGELDPLAIADAREEFLLAVQAMSNYQSQQLQELQKIQSAQEAAAAANFSLRTVMVTMSGIAIVLGIIAAIVLSYGIARPMRKTIETATRLAEGDLTLSELPIRSTDEIGELTGAFNRLITNLQGFVENIQGAVESVLDGGQKLIADSNEATAASAEIAAAIQQVSEGTNHQLSTIDGTQDVIARLRQARERIDRSVQEQAQQAERTQAAIRHVADRMGNFAVAAQELVADANLSDAKARAGSEALKEIAGSMTEVHVLTSGLAKRVDELTALSQEMDEVVQFSRTLADQAQLVSLAATGASNSKDERSNIAIIVEEVRRIAERSAESREQIGHRIASIQAAMASTAEAIQETSPQVEVAAKLVADARGKFDEVVRSADDTKQKALGISTATQELAQLNEEAQRTAEKVTIPSDVASALEELTALSDQLEQTIAAITAVSKDTATATEGVATSAEQIQTVGAQMHASIMSLNAVAETIANLTQQFSQQVEEETAEEESEVEK